jgi:hypothetical protein
MFVAANRRSPYPAIEISCFDLWRNLSGEETERESAIDNGAKLVLISIEAPSQKARTLLSYQHFHLDLRPEKPSNLILI